MSLAGWQEWFGEHIYRALLIVGTLEGLGLPVPGELLFLPAVHLARHGEASYGLIVLLASLGNVVGATIGFSIAFRGGPAFLAWVSRVLKIKPESVQKVESFFARYGEATVFLSKFVGPIRAATIYVAGAARMQPWRFVLYITAACLVANSLLVFLCWKFEHVARKLLRGHPMREWLPWVVGLIALVMVGRYLLLWYRKRKSAGP